MMAEIKRRGIWDIASEIVRLRKQNAGYRRRIAELERAGRQ